jgi:hypothetical protein
MFQIDRYSLRARIYPAIIVLSPLFILGLFLITDLEKYYHYATALVSFGLVSYLFAHLGRDCGKMKEVELFKIWGGKPSTVILRHRDNTIDSITKNRYHSLLNQKIDGINIPTAKEELANTQYSDQIYESCTKFLISKTRDINRFSLLFKENTNYGFRRNLWGMKKLAIILIFLIIIVHAYYLTGGFQNLIHCCDKKLIPLIVYVSYLIFWFVVVTKNWVKLTAFEYSERLIETVQDI